MTRRIQSQTFPDAPSHWDPSSMEVWRRLTQILESSDLFDKARRSRPQFIVMGTVSADLTLDVNNPSVTVLTHAVAKLLNALEGTNFVDIR